MRWISWASLEHKLRYKKDIPADKAKYLEDEMLACAQISADLDMRMQNVRDVIAENAKPDEQSLLLKRFCHKKDILKMRQKKHCEIW